mmetsp:Transcript_30909/g.64515  ORF Transcript_30909/g.64515 Transcript_30909/m.64515 type:complete len:204 (+) Transcript_30909:482-1093(+)
MFGHVGNGDFTNYLVYRTARFIFGTNDITTTNIFHLGSIELDQHIFTGSRSRDGIFIGVHFIHLVNVSCGHDHHLRTRPYCSRFHLTHGNCTTVRVAIQHGDTQRSCGFTIGNHQGIQQAEQCALVCVVFSGRVHLFPPSTFGFRDFLLHIGSAQTRNGNELDFLFNGETALSQERSNFGDNIIKTFLLPLYRWFVHFIDYHN